MGGTSRIGLPASKTEDRLDEALRRAISRASNLERRKLKVVREPNIGPFRPDFLFPELKLIVEVEGPHHFGPEASRRDHARENYFRNNGFYPLRFSVEQVSEDPDSVTDFILEQASKLQRGEKAPTFAGRQGCKYDASGVQRWSRIFWLEEDASRCWKLYTQALREDWLRNGEGEKVHEGLRWNKHVKGDKTISAAVDYETSSQEDARKFAGLVLGRRVVHATVEGSKIIVQIAIA